MTEQLHAFGLTIVGGIVMGVVFDMFRVIRQGWGSRGSLAWVSDVLYWVFVTPPILGLLWQANQGELRFYVVLGIAVGSLLYNALCSYYVIELLSAIWHGVGRTLAWLMHVVVVVATWPVLATRSLVLPFRIRRPARPGQLPRFRLWRPALAWRRR